MRASIRRAMGRGGDDDAADGAADDSASPAAAVDVPSARPERAAPVPIAARNVGGRPAELSDDERAAIREAMRAEMRAAMERIHAQRPDGDDSDDGTAASAAKRPEVEWPPIEKPSAPAAAAAPAPAVSAAPTDTDVPSFAAPSAAPHRERGAADSLADGERGAADGRSRRERGTAALPAEGASPALVSQPAPPVVIPVAPAPAAPMPPSATTAPAATRTEAAETPEEASRRALREALRAELQAARERAGQPTSGADAVTDAAADAGPEPTGRAARRSSDRDGASWRDAGLGAFDETGRIVEPREPARLAAAKAEVAGAVVGDTAAAGAATVPAPEAADDDRPTGRAAERESRRAAKRAAKEERAQQKLAERQQAERAAAEAAEQAAELERQRIQREQAEAAEAERRQQRQAVEHAAELERQRVEQAAADAVERERQDQAARDQAAALEAQRVAEEAQRAELERVEREAAERAAAEEAQRVAEEADRVKQERIDREAAERAAAEEAQRVAEEAAAREAERQRAEQAKREAEEEALLREAEESARRRAAERAAQEAAQWAGQRGGDAVAETSPSSIDVALSAAATGPAAPAIVPDDEGSTDAARVVIPDVTLATDAAATIAQRPSTPLLEPYERRSRGPLIASEEAVRREAERWAETRAAWEKAAREEQWSLEAARSEEAVRREAESAARRALEQVTSDPGDGESRLPAALDQDAAKRQELEENMRRAAEEAVRREAERWTVARAEWDIRDQVARELPARDAIETAAREAARREAALRAEGGHERWAAEEAARRESERIAAEEAAAREAARQEAERAAAAEEADRLAAAEAEREAAERAAAEAELQRAAAEEAERLAAEEADRLAAAEEVQRRTAAEEMERRAAETAAREAAEQAAAEEAARLAAEEAQRRSAADEAKRLAAEEAERLAADEAARLAAEEAAAEEAERQAAAEEAQRRAAAEETERPAAADHDSTTDPDDDGGTDPPSGDGPGNPPPPSPDDSPSDGAPEPDEPAADEVTRPLRAETESAAVQDPPYDGAELAPRASLSPTDRVIPSWTDPTVRRAADLIGGPLGRHASIGRNRVVTPLRVVLIFALAALIVGWLAKSPCIQTGAGGTLDQEGQRPWITGCYNDIVPLYGARGLGDPSRNPYAYSWVDNGADQPVGQVYTPGQVRQDGDEWVAVRENDTVVVGDGDVIGDQHTGYQHLVDGRLEPLPADGPPTVKFLEYPVLTGYFTWGAAALTSGYLAIADGDGLLPAPLDVGAYFTITAILLGLLYLWAIASTVTLTRRRIWDVAMMGLAPLLMVHAFTNWDLIAIAFTAAGMAAWARGRRDPDDGRSGARSAVIAGLLLGLGAAAKLYPALLLGPLAVLCLRTGQLRRFWFTLGGAVGAWLLVNVPNAIAYPRAWAEFFSLNSTRGPEWNSWYFLSTLIAPIQDWWQTDKAQATTLLNIGSLLLFMTACAAIGWLALSAARRPRFAQLAFLVVVAFLLTNKVFSPQYSLWLLPLVVLALPRWRPVILWQLAEVCVWYLLMLSFDTDTGKNLPIEPFAVAAVVRGGLLVMLVVMVVKDILRPERDRVRICGDDDPSGGVLDGAADRYTLPSLPALWRRARHPVVSPSVANM